MTNHAAGTPKRQRPWNPRKRAALLCCVALVVAAGASSRTVAHCDEVREAILEDLGKAWKPPPDSAESPPRWEQWKSCLEELDDLEELDENPLQRWVEAAAVLEFGRNRHGAVEYDPLTYAQERLYLERAPIKTQYLQSQQAHGAVVYRSYLKAIAVLIVERSGRMWEWVPPVREIKQAVSQGDWTSAEDPINAEDLISDYFDDVQLIALEDCSDKLSRVADEKIREWITPGMSPNHCWDLAYDMPLTLSQRLAVLDALGRYRRKRGSDGVQELRDLFLDDFNAFTDLDPPEWAEAWAHRAADEFDRGRIQRAVDRWGKLVAARRVFAEGRDALEHVTAFREACLRLLDGQPVAALEEIGTVEGWEQIPRLRAARVVATYMLHGPEGEAGARSVAQRLNVESEDLSEFADLLKLELSFLGSE